MRLESAGLRILIWNSMLSADLNFRYYSELAVRFQTVDHWAKIFLAITSSTAVSGWALWDTPGWEWLWKSLSAASALIALSLPVLDPAGSMKTASSLRGAWFSILKDYELLWSDAPDAETDARVQFTKLVQEEKRLVELERAMRRRRGIQKRCDTEVRRSRGLE